VFIQELDSPFPRLPSQFTQYDTEPLVISESDILSKLDKINQVTGNDESKSRPNKAKSAAAVYRRSNACYLLMWR